MIQPVDSNYLYQGNMQKATSILDNFVYLHHTDTLIAIPTFPESISDTMSVNFSQSDPISRSAPIYSYTKSGPRELQISLNLHRDLMYDLNKNSALNVTIDNDYIDVLAAQIQAAALPRYAAAEKMVDPPIVSVRFGNDIFCKGVISGSVTVTYSGPILRTNKYAQVDISFNLHEIDPFDADTVMTTGSYRGISTDLERRVWKG